jgi:hypothetical protein
VPLPAARITKCSGVDMLVQQDSSPASFRTGGYASPAALPRSAAA